MLSTDTANMNAFLCSAMYTLDLTAINIADDPTLETDFGPFKIIDISWPGHGTMNAATFRHHTGSMYIAYRGTGANNWRFNADSAFGESPSYMQLWAHEYFDETIKRHYFGQEKLYVTGHSQGGNNAIYAALFSEHGCEITNVIAFDAPGFSHAVINAAQHLSAEHFLAMQKKIYALNGENDFVHPLGEVNVILPENSFYIRTPSAECARGCHDITTRFIPGTNQLNEWGHHVERGQIPQVVASINANFIEHLTPAQRQNAAAFFMALVERRIGNGLRPQDIGVRDALLAVRDMSIVLAKTAKSARRSRASLRTPRRKWNILA